MSLSDALTHYARESVVLVDNPKPTSTVPAAAPDLQKETFAAFDHTLTKSLATLRAECLMPTLKQVYRRLGVDLASTLQRLVTILSILTGSSESISQSKWDVYCTFLAKNHPLFLVKDGLIFQRKEQVRLAQLY